MAQIFLKLDLVEVPVELQDTLDILRYLRYLRYLKWFLVVLSLGLYSSGSVSLSVMSSSL